MMKRVLILIGVLLIILGVLFSIRFFSAKQPQDGVLNVETSPEASVFLDNRLLGRAPIEQRIPTGEYIVKVVPESVLDSFVSWQGKVTIEPNRLTFVRTDLGSSELLTAVDILWLEKTGSKAGEVSVVTNPDGAGIYMDDTSYGSSPITIPNVTAGDHMVQVTSPGFVPRSLKIRSTAGYKVNTSVKLSLLPLEARQAAPVASASPTPVVAGAQNQKRVKISSTPVGFLRVRSQPSTSASESGRVQPEDSYTVIEEQDGWLKIEYQTGKVGWVSSRYTLPIP